MTLTTPSEVPVDTAALQAVLDGRWAAIRKMAREQLPAFEPENAIDRDVEGHRARTLERLQLLADSGEPRLGFAKEYGGGGDVGGAITSFEMLALGDLSLMVKAGVQWGLFGGAVQALGTQRHHEKYLEKIMTLELPGCFAMTEVGRGSDVQSARTTITYDAAAQEFVVHTPEQSARKDYIGNAARDGRMAVVFGQLVTHGQSHGVHAVLVPIRDEAGNVAPGVTIEDDGLKAGLNGVDNGRISFAQVRVPRENLLDRYGQVAEDGTYSSPIESSGRRFFTMLGTLVRGRVSVAGAAGSATKSALAIAVSYGNKRTQFERPRKGDAPPEEVVILDYLGHQRKLLPRLARTYAIHFAQEDLVTRLHEIQGTDAGTGKGEEADVDGMAQRELENRAAGMKVAATWHATATIQAAREACGGAGYLSENRLPQMKADTDVFTTFEGDNTVLLQLVAKGLLTEYSDHVGDLDPIGIARFVAEQVVEQVAEATKVPALIQRLRDAVPGRDESHLSSLEWQLDLFADREEHMLASLAQRLRKALDPENDAFEVFNAAQDHLLHTARAHIDRLLLEAFVAGIRKVDRGPVKQLLVDVCDLFVLSTIEEDRAWFIEHGRISTATSKSVITEVNVLCQKLRPHAQTLVDAFGIPHAWIDTPMTRTGHP